MLGNMLPIVQAIDTNKLRWCGLITRREEESMLRVMMQLKANGKRSRGDQDLSCRYTVRCNRADIAVSVSWYNDIEP